jgi:hypothetical protein
LLDGSFVSRRFDGAGAADPVAAGGAAPVSVGAALRNEQAGRNSSKATAPTTAHLRETNAIDLAKV